VLADIPGLIEGAHAGAGLGHEFLKHIERTRLIVHMVEPSPADLSDPLDNFRCIREELEKYNPELAGRPEILCVSKSELPDADDCAARLREATGREVLLISGATGSGIGELNRIILQQLAEVAST
ncbi:MAG: 50S ribosome-binding GTPase, partial [Planctomycetaceae bacterium]|nr:50S ribosome-binding GTPase [Planctomycetaceae bacterium]